MKTFVKENWYKLMIVLSALILSIAVLMYIVSITKSPSSLNERVTGDPIRIDFLDRLEVAEYDFPKYMNRNDAKKACKALGSGWRLPADFELDVMYHHRDEIVSLSPEWYWSSSVVGDGINFWSKDFNTGKWLPAHKDNLSNVRAVRSF